MVIFKWHREPSPAEDGMWGRSRWLQQRDGSVWLTLGGTQTASREAGIPSQDRSLPGFQWLQINLCFWKRG